MTDTSRRPKRKVVSKSSTTSEAFLKKRFRRMIQSDERMEGIVERIHGKYLCNHQECERCEKKQLCEWATKTRNLLFRYEAKQKA